MQVNLEFEGNHATLDLIKHQLKKEIEDVIKTYPVKLTKVEFKKYDIHPKRNKNFPRSKK